MAIRCKLGLHTFVEVAHKSGVGTIERCKHCNQTRTWIDLKYIMRVQEAEKEIIGSA